MRRGWLGAVTVLAGAMLMGVAAAPASPAAATAADQAQASVSTQAQAQTQAQTQAQAPATVVREAVEGSLQTVASGGKPGGWQGWSVEAWVSGAAAAVAQATADPDGHFVLPVDVTLPAGGVFYVVAHAAVDAGHPDAPRATLAAVYPAVPTVAVLLNERTTVAGANAMAQFVSDSGIAGAAPGLVNSAGMAANLADPLTGALSQTLTSSPNGSETSTMAEFDSLTAALASCVTNAFADPVRYPAGTCAELLDVAQAAGTSAPADTFRAFAEIARNPGADPDRLFALTQQAALADSAPVLDRSPVAWTIALRFDGDGQSLAGPGNFAVDYQGNIWVINNYQYNADPLTPVCGSDELFEFSPTGGFSKYTGGGLSGAGYGVKIDPRTGNLWVANYGFAAPAPGCPAADQPPHNSSSLFTEAGQALSPATGFTQGDLNWPQGIAIDSSNSVWFANCNSGTVTVYPGGDPNAARTIAADQLDLSQPFDIVDNGQGLFVSGIVNDAVDKLGYDGSVAAGSPGVNAAFDHPMGLATDSNGTVWVANSAVVALPCPTAPNSTAGETADFEAILGSQFDDRGVYTGVGANPYIGSVAAIAPDGTDATRYTGGGATVPWGITTDGNGNVWVANFAGKRLSAFCGTNEATCPAGVHTGEAISPDITGYYFDGLVRNTGVAVDQSGNVWLANNWQEVPIQTNPGGHQIVAYLGLAAPVTIAAPSGTPVTPTTPTPTPTAGAAGASGGDSALAATGASASPLLLAAALAVVALGIGASLTTAARRRRGRTTRG